MARKSGDVRNGFVNHNRWTDHHSIPCKRCCGPQATTFNTRYDKPGICVAQLHGYDRTNQAYLYVCPCGYETAIPAPPPAGS